MQISDDKQIKQAMGVAFFVGGLDVLIGLVAELTPIEELLMAGINYAVVIEGAVFLFLGYFIYKRKAWASLTASILLVLDTLLYIIASADGDAGTASIVGALLIKIFLIICLFKGYKAIKKQS